MLKAFCENVFHVGPPGSGHVLKLINNMLAMTTAAAIAEAVAVAAKNDLPLAKLYDVVSAGGVNSGIFQMMFGQMLLGNLAGLKFAIANGQKDLRYYTHLAEASAVPSFIAKPRTRASSRPSTSAMATSSSPRCSRPRSRPQRSPSLTNGDKHE